MKNFAFQISISRSRRLRIVDLLFTCATLLAVATAQGADSDLVVIETYKNAMDKQTTKISALPADNSRTCETRYQRMWSDKALKIDYYYGYLGKSGASIVSDRQISYTAVQQFLRLCQPNVSACGFKLIADESAANGPYTLTKPSAQGDVILRIWSSALKDWRELNTHGVGNFFIANKRQSRKTKSIWSSYFSSYQTADVVIYNGHSELGTGPGFGPMGTLQYAVGKLAKPHWKKFVNGILALPAGPRPEVVMLAACESKKYYLKGMQKLFPNAAIAATDHEMGFRSGEQHVFGFIDSLMAKRCTSQMEEAMTPVDGADAGMHIYGFE